MGCCQGIYEPQAMGCGTYPAIDVMKRLLLAGEVNRDDGNAILRQLLQLDKWPTCHTLYLNLWRMLEVVEATPAQIRKISQANTALPLLQYVHIIGRDEEPFTDSDSEDDADNLLMSILANRAPDLTGRVKVIETPLDLPSLQHLVLDLGTTWGRELRYTLMRFFPMLSMLEGVKAPKLESLFVSLPAITVSGPTDLTTFENLRRVATQRVRFEGLLALPAGCCFHALSMPQYVREVTKTMAHLVSGIALNRMQRWNLKTNRFWNTKWFLMMHPRCET